jgi:hypothetical protein
MKSASTPERTEEILYDIVGGSRSKPVAKLEYSQDQGSSFTEFDDIKTIDYSTSNNSNQYSKFLLVPPAKTMGASFDNKEEKYSPGSGGEFDGVLKRNLLVKPSFGYQMQDETEYTQSIAASSYSILYHTKVSGSSIVNDIVSASSFTNLPGVTDSWLFYDGQNYDSGTYSPEGYWLSTVKNYTDPFNTLELIKLTMTSTTTDVHVYYRSSDIQNDLTNNTKSFTSLGECAVGVNNFTLPDIKDRYFQIAIVFDTSIWGVGDISDISVTYTTRYEFFEAGQYLVDNPTFTSSFGSYGASISARDKFKKALETKVSSPSYTSSTDVAKIIRDAADRSGIPHFDGVELIADTGYTVIIADDDNFKNINALKLFNECMTYLNWKNNDYRLELNTDGQLQLVIKDSTVSTADWQLDYRYNLLSLSKQYESENLTQRITVLSKSHTVNAETQLATATYNTTQTGTTLSWANDAIYKRIEVDVNSGDGVFTLNVTENDSINFDITGTSIDVTVTVFGDELQASPPNVGESIYWNNQENKDGITHQVINRLIQSDDEARDVAKSLTDTYGNPEFVVTARLPYNPLLELGDRLLIWEKYTNTNTIYRVDSINVSYSANGASLYQTLKLTDLGTDMTDVNWDRNNVINGGTQEGVDDIDRDSGYIWDQGLGLVDEDTNDYSNRKEVQFS